MATEFVIPSKIGCVTVICVGYNAFWFGYDKLESIVMPQSVTRIERGFFPI